MLFLVFLLFFVQALFSSAYFIQALRELGGPNSDCIAPPSITVSTPKVTKNSIYRVKICLSSPLQGLPPKMASAPGAEVPKKEPIWIANTFAVLHEIHDVDACDA